ncbi:WD repeat-containing protein 76 isoform X2 [Macadamia integrifolia]|uniref:WD repeat-containing protein 76 isoform X2 n=1 Tax=Macadamia integrifolia TaxID=60698 RepID=UPI001C4E8C32|nr:WD repeat-containing protein 76 isoform X2 [Macadamia integrifolia]
MDTQTLTEYERQRLENIKRNGEMMASLKLHSTVQELSSATKRNRVEAKGYKVAQSKKPKPEAPIVLRRSLRTRGVQPDSSSAGGVEDDLVVSPNKTSGSSSPRVLGPLSMKDAHIGDSPERQLIDTIVNMWENTPLSCAIKTELFPIKEERNSLGAIRVKREAEWDMEKTPLNESTRRELGNNGAFYSISMIKSEEAPSSSLNLASLRVKPENKEDMEKTPLNNSIKREIDDNGASYAASMSVSEKSPSSSFNLSLRLKPENIARVVPGRILNVCFFPTTYRLVVVAGNKFGNVGFWDVDCQEGEGDGIYLYRPHSAPVSGILIQPFSLSKVFTSCYDGLIRLLDVEKESFDLVYSCEYPIFSLSQRPDDAKSLYFGEGQGGLNVWDERAGKSSSSWMLHEQRINTIHFNPKNSNLMATSSTDGTACVWDLRRIDANKPKSLMIVDHRRAVHSAYFSPSGNCLATTSYSDNVGVLRGADFTDVDKINVDLIHHNNQTGRWISSFRAIWGWCDSYVFIGNMRRGVDVISTTDRRTMMTLESPRMSAIPCRLATHPYKAGILAGATAGGQVYIWTSS